MRFIPTFLVALALQSPYPEAHGALYFHFKSTKAEGDFGKLIWRVSSIYTGLGGVIALFFSPAVGGGLILLDDEGTYEDADLASILHQRYPFIEDREVIADLTYALASEVTTVGSPMDPETPVTAVSLPRETVLHILAPLDLDDQKAEQVINDLAPTSPLNLRQ